MKNMVLGGIENNLLQTMGGFMTKKKDRTKVVKEIQQDQSEQVTVQN